MTAPTTRASIAEQADLSLLEPTVTTSFVQAVNTATSFGALFSIPATPEAIFRHAVASAINAIEARGDLLRRFLTLGPYECDGPIPQELHEKRLSDEECTKAVTLIYSHAINCFKGQLAEVFALGSFITLTARLQQDGLLPRSSVAYVGDAAMPLRGPTGVARSRLSYNHCIENGSSASGGRGSKIVSGLSEPHETATRSSCIACAPRPSNHTIRGNNTKHPTKKGCRGNFIFSAAPSTWRLSRSFHFVDDNGRSFLHSADLPTIPQDEVVQVGPSHWHILLGWSQEALASLTYSLTCWYMEELGRVIFTEDHASPWPEMTPEEAGANSAKQTLYYAIRRCTTARSEQRAIALYDAYCFGYPLGTSFKDPAGRR